ncbi:hypothetical protein CLOM_g7747 [Closterium sp. NIES-68]|nr:hypothetical protein CLOM_g7747 [Closterium sp. NIES-68]GJP81259.1 hypothetical protein CLOP_g11420 [Closterium sp. NIES-67]
MQPSAFTALSCREVGRPPLSRQRLRDFFPVGALDRSPVPPSASASATPRAAYCPRALPGYLNVRAWSSLQAAAHDCYDYPLPSSASAMQMDASDQRYLLVGSASGAITAFDTAVPTALDPLGHPCHPPLFALPRAPSTAHAARAPPPTADGASATPPGAAVAHSLAVAGVAWYPVDTGLFLSGSLDGLVKLWDTHSLQSLLSFRMPGRVADVAMSHVQGAPALAAAACADGNVRLCDVASGAATHMLHGDSGAITCVSWSPSSPFHLASGSSAGAIRIWDIRRPGALHSLHHRHSQSALRPPLLPRRLPAAQAGNSHRGTVGLKAQGGQRASAQGGVGAVGKGGKGVGDGFGLGRKRGREESGGAGRGRECEGERAVVGNAGVKQAKAARSEGGNLHGAEVGFVGWWGGGGGIRVRIGWAARVQGGGVGAGLVQQRQRQRQRQWQWQGGEETGQVAHEGAVLSMAPTPNGLFLLSYGSDQRLRLWDVEEGANTLIHYANQRAPRGALASGTVRFCVSHDGSLVFLPQGPCIQVFHTWTGESLASLHAHFDNVLLCCSHPALPQLFSSGADRQLLSWTSALLDHLHSPHAHLPTSRSRGHLQRRKQGPLPDEDAWSD